MTKLPKNPPLHVELSDPARGCLNHIKKSRGWNNKTTVESALNFFHLHGDHIDCVTGENNMQWSFRPTPINGKRLKLASEIGLNVSELLNEAIEETFDNLLKRKSLQIQSALEKNPAS